MQEDFKYSSVWWYSLAIQYSFAVTFEKHFVFRHFKNIMDIGPAFLDECLEDFECNNNLRQIHSNVCTLVEALVAFSEVQFFHFIVCTIYHFGNGS